MKTITVSSLLIFILFTMCKSDSGNEKKEYIDQSNAIADKFMRVFKNAYYDSATCLTSNIDIKEIRKGARMSDSLIGKISNYERITTDFMESYKLNKREISINVYYKVKRMKKESTRIIYIERINDSLKIVGFDDKYNIN